MPSSGVNEKIGQSQQCEVQENGGDIGNVKKSGNIYREVIVRSSYPLNKEDMDGVLHNHSQEDGDDSCEEFVDSSRLSSAANSESSGRSDKEKGNLFCRIIRSPSFTKRGSIGNVLNSLYPNTKNEGPTSRASTNKPGASMGLPEANQSGTTDVPKSKNIKKSASNAESLKAIVQKNVVDRCQGVQRTRRNSIASYKPMTGALESSLRDSVQNVKWNGNSGKDPVISCETVCNVKSNLNSNNNTKNSIKTRTYSSDHVSHTCKDPGGVKVELKTSNLTNPSYGIRKSQSRVDRRAASPKPIRLTKRDGREDPQIRSQQTSCTMKGKCSPTLPFRAIDPPERKSSATIIKRSPVAIVIPNEKTEKKGNALERYQVPNVVSFINSNFKPLGQEEAEEYSMMKREEAIKSSKNSSRVTCYDEEGGMICKLATATRPPLVEDSPPTNERFVALSERFAALKAKIRGNEIKQNSQFSSPASSELRHCSSEMSDALEFSKCRTPFETAPNGEFQDRLSGFGDGLLDHKIEKTSLVKDGGKQSGTTASQNSGAHFMAATFNVKEIEREVDKQFSKNVGRAYDYETEGDVKWGRSVDENNNEISSVVNNASKIDVTFDGIGSLDKTALVRPESFAPSMRTSVVAKLMDRKMIFRKRQSIEPKMMKRQSLVYKYSSAESAIPRTLEQFEWTRAHVESTVLREPVRDEALTIKELLNVLSSCLSETELIAICKECAKTLRTLDALGSLPSYVSLDSVIINPSGTVKFKHLSTGISVDDYYLAPEHSKRFASEKVR
ncbi:PREDICTED: uncharacterized protein LOC107337827 [Acropora digitifera]|uniref:uncharacterized protein LOC107337827 n=1 Tax=Acropora digitifera TaxID=70779 RepID=UPI00077B1502|nr:PREDICTED: uncharacterized protein LOC107337827 [Acropora digitifera]